MSGAVSLLVTHGVNHSRSGVGSFPRLTFCTQTEACAEAKWRSIFRGHMGPRMWGWQVWFKLRSCHNPSEKLSSAETATGVWTDLSQFQNEHTHKTNTQGTENTRMYPALLIIGRKCKKITFLTSFLTQHWPRTTQSNKMTERDNTVQRSSSPCCPWVNTCFQLLWFSNIFTSTQHWGANELEFLSASRKGLFMSVAWIHWTTGALLTSTNRKKYFWCLKMWLSTR